MKDILDLYYDLCNKFNYGRCSLKEENYYLYYGEKKYICSLCGLGYVSYKDLRYHNTNRHCRRKNSEELFVEIWLNGKWPKCLNCGEKIKRPKRHLRFCSPKCSGSYNMCNLHSLEDYSEICKEKGRRMAETRKRKNNFFSWNTGLTKKTNGVLKEISEKHIQRMNSEKYKGSSEHKKFLEFLRIPRSKKHCKNLSEAHKKKFKEDENYKEMVLKNALKGAKISINRNNNKLVKSFRDNFLKDINYETEVFICPYFVDFLIADKKIIIEVLGDYWHCNPQKYNRTFYNKRKHMTSEEIWQKDQQRKQELINKGYKILEFWEHDIRHNPEIIKKQLLGVN